MAVRAGDGRFGLTIGGARLTQPNGRTSSIRTVIAAAAKAGRAVPTDAEMAALFAISIERVRHHRRLLGM